MHTSWQWLHTSWQWYLYDCLCNHVVPLVTDGMADAIMLSRRHLADVLFNVVEVVHDCSWLRCINDFYTLAYRVNSQSTPV